jgi:hypothetical protein
MPRFLVLFARCADLNSSMSGKRKPDVTVLLRYLPAMAALVVTRLPDLHAVLMERVGFFFVAPTVRFRAVRLAATRKQLVGAAYRSKVGQGVGG